MLQSPRFPGLYGLLSTGKLVTLKRRQVFYSSEDKNVVMIPVRGYVKRYLITNNGSQGIQMVFGPQDVFSLTKVFDTLLGQSLYDGPETFYYQAMSDVRMYALDAGEFRRGVESDPLLYKELFVQAGYHLKACVHRLENLSLSNAHARVAHHILFYAKGFSANPPDEAKLALAMTQQDIAGMLGIARETVTSALAKLRRDEVLGPGRQITVLNMEALREAAYG